MSSSHFIGYKFRSIDERNCNVTLELYIYFLFSIICQFRTNYTRKTTETIISWLKKAKTNGTECVTDQAQKFANEYNWWSPHDRIYRTIKTQITPAFQCCWWCPVVFLKLRRSKNKIRLIPWMRDSILGHYHKQNNLYYTKWNSADFCAVNRI